MPSCSEDLAFRGLVHQVSDRDLLRRFDSGHEVVYIGFDPSFDSLHVGNLLQLCTLRRLQDYGHRPIAVAGSGTGLIGDPGGKDEERPLLSREQLDHNVAAIRHQMARILEFSSSAETGALLLENGEWLAPLTLVDFLRDVGKHFTVNQIVAKESVRARFERPDVGISYTEFSYMLLQAYDFLYLFDRYGCRVQLGGSDQWGNITMGVELIRKVRAASAYAMTSPLITKPDGTKFGKSESGALFLDAKKTSPYTLYQFFLRTEDAVVGSYLRYFTFLSHEEIAALDQATAEAPQERQAQRVLASEVVTLVHGAGEAARAKHAGEVLFSEEVASLDEATLLQLFAEAPSSSLDKKALAGEGLDPVDAFSSSGLVPSKSAARAAISQGGAYLNNRRLSDGDRITEADLIAGRYVVLRRGRREQHLLRFE